MTNKEISAIIATMIELIAGGFFISIVYGIAILLGFGLYSVTGFLEKLRDEVPDGFIIYILCPLAGFFILSVIVLTCDGIYNMYKKNLTIITEEELDLSLVDEKEKL